MMLNSSLNRTAPIRGFFLMKMGSAGLRVADAYSACRNVSPPRVFHPGSARNGALVTELAFRAVVAESNAGP